jgi:acetyl esterase
VVYLHGGGWVVGSFRTHERLVRELTHQAGVVTVFQEYPLSPETRHPIALTVCHELLGWLAESGRASGSMAVCSL